MDRDPLKRPKIDEVVKHLFKILQEHKMENDPVIKELQINLESLSVSLDDLRAQPEKKRHGSENIKDAPPKKHKGKKH